MCWQLIEAMLMFSIGSKVGGKMGVCFSLFTRLKEAVVLESPETVQ